ncbi:hypothetical protein BJX61DRAFT_174684 [Aspergillus egyptiacus]|nr:hypothetical protein BJX61DRAFT_174684 [Aspergillus egyptiacus]
MLRSDSPHKVLPTSPEHLRCSYRTFNLEFQKTWSILSSLSLHHYTTDQRCCNYGTQIRSSSTMVVSAIQLYDESPTFVSPAEIFVDIHHTLCFLRSTFCSWFSGAPPPRRLRPVREDPRYLRRWYGFWAAHMVFMCIRCIPHTCSAGILWLSIITIIRNSTPRNRPVHENPATIVE